MSMEEGLQSAQAAVKEVKEEGEGEVKSEERQGEEEDDGACSDQELDELLNFSLGEFGKHVPAAVPDVSQSSQQELPPALHLSSEQGSGGRAAGSTTDASSSSNMQAFEEIFSEEFAAQAQAQLGEAMQLLSKEDPQMWQQLQGFSATAASNLQSVPEGGGRGESGEGSEGGRGEGGSLEATLEDTLRRLQESTQQIESSSEGVSGEGGAEGLSDRLSQLLSQLGEGEGEGEGGEGEEGEEGLVKMMEGMMGTLLSRDVLYPSLTEICKQYPDWLSSRRGRLSPEDYSRYCKQLEVMRAICQEFERQEREGGGSEGAGGGGGERILQLMQQLQQYGQPPPELAGDTFPQGLPSLPGFPQVPPSGGPVPADCSIM